METRLLVAYGLIALVGMVGVLAGGVVQRRRAKRRRRLRGIKTDEVARMKRRQTT